MEVYTGKELERYQEGDVFHSGAIAPRPNFSGKPWAEHPYLLPWLFYLLFSIDMDILWKEGVWDKLWRVICKRLEVLAQQDIPEHNLAQEKYRICRIFKNSWSWVTSKVYLYIIKW